MRIAWCPQNKVHKWVLFGGLGSICEQVVKHSYSLVSSKQCSEMSAFRLSETFFLSRWWSIRRAWCLQNCVNNCCLELWASTKKNRGIHIRIAWCLQNSLVGCPKNPTKPHSYSLESSNLCSKMSAFRWSGTFFWTGREHSYTLFSSKEIRLIVRVTVKPTVKVTIRIAWCVQNYVQ